MRLLRTAGGFQCIVFLSGYPSVIFKGILLFMFLSTQQSLTGTTTCKRAPHIWVWTAAAAIETTRSEQNRAPSKAKHARHGSGGPAKSAHAAHLMDVAVVFPACKTPQSRHVTSNYAPAIFRIFSPDVGAWKCSYLIPQILNRCIIVVDSSGLTKTCESRPGKAL